FTPKMRNICTHTTTLITHFS
ncbi:hypothetical protein D043_3987B, partial [Vibrio parahaemolyticus EKP-021]